MPVEVLSVAHVNVNCSDLARALAFCRDVLGLAPLVHTNPEQAQDGTPFGIEGPALWDAYMMCDGRGMEGPALDLLEWRTPRPVGRPYESVARPGLSAIGFAVGDLRGVAERVTARGGTVIGDPGGGGLLTCLDPDGTRLELRERRGQASRFEWVRVNCSDLAASVAWYRRVLSLDPVGELRSDPVSARVPGVAGEAAWEGVRLAPRSAPDAFAIDLVQWRSPPPAGRPYECANHLGLFRLAFLVADARAGSEELRRAGVEASRPAFLDMGPEVPVEGVWAVFFRDPDGTCLELIGVPEVRASV